MASEKKDYGVTFVNIELKFKPELYLPTGKELPDEKELFVWQEAMERAFYRSGGGYNEQSSSWTASLTYKGGKPSEKPTTVTQHGKSKLSAVRKLWVVYVILGAFREGYDVALERLDELEREIEDAIERLMK